MPESWLPRSPLSSNKNTAARRAAGVSLYLSHRLVTPENCSGLAAFTRSEGSHPHKGALCLCAPGRAAGAPGTVPKQRRDGHPRPTAALQPSAPPSAATTTHRFKDRASLGLSQPAPPRRAEGEQATPEKFTLSPRGALKASRPREGRSAPDPAGPIRGAADAGLPPGPLTSRPVHHLLGAPLGHGFHGGWLGTQRGWSRQ